MPLCTGCRSVIEQEESFCPACGLRQPQRPRPKFPWRAVAIVVLSLFIVLGTGQLLHDRFKDPAGEIISDLGEQELKEAEDLIDRTLSDLRLTNTWEYPQGVMEEYTGLDVEGHLITIYRDAASGIVRGFTAALPPATEVDLSLVQAQNIAEQLAS